MWKPAERIKYKATVEQWPTREETTKSRLFSPVDTGPVSLRQRTWIPAMVPWRSNEDGFVTDDVLQWYERFAIGRPGAIVVEATGIRDIPSGPLLRIGDDRFIPGLKELVKTVDEASNGETRLFIKLIDFLSIRRRPEPEKFFQRFLKITDAHRDLLNTNSSSEDEIRHQLQGLEEKELERVLTDKELEDLQFGYRERVTDTHLPHIQDLPTLLPELFANAAQRAAYAGFDGVELHYAHAYTMASFLSAKNTRSDGYGGKMENRVRLPLEVYQAVRDKTDDGFAVGCRFLSDEIIPGGSQVHDACYFASRFAEAGMDFLSLSRGGKFEDAKQPRVGGTSYPYTGQSGYECMPSYISDEKGPFGRNIEPVSAIHTAVQSVNKNIPVVLAGGIYNFYQAEQILKEDKADIIALARQSLADPDWFRKVQSGYGDEVNVCRYSNYCEGLDQKHKQVTCELWDRTVLDEPGIVKTIDGRRRMVAPLWDRKL
jgi:2,4-dienoyl-CoA reductase-like NADH-dependent reductase (Old Yellow Enzyme family)